MQNSAKSEGEKKRKVRQESIWFAMPPNHQINFVIILDWVNFTVVISRYLTSYKSPCVT